MQGQIMQSREAGGHRPARGRRHARDQQSAGHHQRLRRGHPGAARRRGDRARGHRGEYLEIIDKEVERCTRIVDGCSTSAAPSGKCEARGAAERHGGGDALPAEAPPAVQAARRDARAGPRAAQRAGQRGAAHPGAHGTDAQRGRRDGRGRQAHGPHRSGAGPGRRGCPRDGGQRGPAFPGRTRPRSSSRSTPPSRRGGAPGWALASATASSRTHRGRIEVDSQPGRGALFRVHLPVAAAHEDSGDRGRPDRRAVREARAGGAALSGRSGGRRDGGAPPRLRRAVRPDRARPPAPRR